MASDKYKKLAKNSAVFLIGNLGSKIISFFIVPFYTYVLTTEEYGAADLVTTTVNLIAPFAMLGMNEAVLRFSASREMSEESIASNSMSMVLLGWAICWALFPVFQSFSVIGDNVVLFLLLLCLTSFNNVFLQLLRGVGKSRAFAANGVLITFVTATANIISLAVFHQGVAGYLGSMVIAQLAGAVHIFLSCRMWQLLSFRNVSMPILKAMLVYCVPLIPNSLMWWVMSASDRYVILFFIGASANGIYNVSQKIPSVVNVIYNVFMQAWQVSAIEEKDSKDNARFQSTVFRYIFALLAIVTSLIAASAYPVYNFLMSSAYEGSWQFVALLSLANLLSCIGSFFGVTYVVTKESGKAFSTTAVGAVVNLALTLIFVPLFGIMGAALATAISYAVIAVVRSRDTRQFVQIEYDRRKIKLSIILIVLQTLISCFDYHPILLTLQFALFACIAFILRRDIFDIVAKGAKLLRNYFASRGRTND